MKKQRRRVYKPQAFLFSSLCLSLHGLPVCVCVCVCVRACTPCSSVSYLLENPLGPSSHRVREGWMDVRGVK